MDRMKRRISVVCVVLMILSDFNAVGADFRHRVIRDEKGELAFRHRSGSGPTLLLIPGTFSDGDAFSDLVGRLEPDLNLVIAEHRGVGSSWPPMNDPSIERCADDAIRIMDELNCEQFFTAGHSLGGMISLELGWKHPKRVLGVISIEGWTNSDAAKNAFQGDMRSTLSAAQQAQLAAERSRVLKKWTPEQIQTFGTIWRKWDGTEFLKTTTIPVLELYGDRNRPRADPLLLGIPDRPNIQLVWFSGASHSLHIERPTELAAELNRFISTTAKSQRIPEP